MKCSQTGTRSSNSNRDSEQIMKLLFTSRISYNSTKLYSTTRKGKGEEACRTLLSVISEYESSALTAGKKNVLDENENILNEKENVLHVEEEHS